MICYCDNLNCDGIFSSGYITSPASGSAGGGSINIFYNRKEESKIDYKVGYISGNQAANNGWLMIGGSYSDGGQRWTWNF